MSAEGDEMMDALLLERIEKLEERVAKLEGGKKKPSGKSDGAQIFDEYTVAFMARYSVAPVRNPKVNTQASLLVGRVGKEDALELVRFYLKQNDRFYTQAMHPLGYCLLHAETLFTRMKSGTRVTPAQAKMMDEADGNAHVMANYARKKHERRSTSESEGGAGA